MRQVFLYPNVLLWIHEVEWKHSVKEPGIWQHFLEISLELSSVGMSTLFSSSIWHTYEVEATADFSISFVQWIQATMLRFLASKKSFNQAHYGFRQSWILDALKLLWIPSLFTQRILKKGHISKKKKKKFPRLKPRHIFCLTNIKDRNMFPRCKLWFMCHATHKPI